jgi:RNA polymerase sigma factor (sigma-70 family)
MDFVMATQWVKDNEAVIKNKIRQYRKFTPYEMSDFFQEAHEAALVAVLRSQEKAIPFEAAFWTIFRNKISVLTPNPDSPHGSNSIPSHLCSVEYDSNEQSSPDDRDGPDIEAIFEAISNHLTEREKQTLSLSLGMAEEGKLSTYEIAELFGCSDFNVRETLRRAFKRIKRLAENGTIAVDRMRLITNRDLIGFESTQGFGSAPYAARSPLA